MGALKDRLKQEEADRARRSAEIKARRAEEATPQGKAKKKPLTTEELNSPT